MRTLGKVAMTQPAAVTACNLDLENLLQDVNRSVLPAECEGGGGGSVSDLFHIDH